MNSDKDKLLKVLFDYEPVNPDELELNKISEAIIGCAFKVGNTLGCGFLEKVYENALVYEIRRSGLTVSQQHPIPVNYEDIVVGNYEADLVVEGKILVELKAVRDLNQVHRAQCLNYLRATGFKLCLLINFGNPRVEVKRIIR